MSSPYRYRNKSRTRFQQTEEHLKSALSSIETFLLFVFGACSYACDVCPSSVYSDPPNEKDDELYSAIDDYSCSSLTQQHSHESSSHRHRTTPTNMNRKHTAISITQKCNHDNDDDVSCISSNTMENVVVAYDNGHYATVADANRAWNTKTGHHSTSDKENLGKHTARSIQDTLSVSESFASMASSNGTSEFSSVWKQPLGDQSHSNNTTGVNTHGGVNETTIMVDKIHGNRFKPSHTTYSGFVFYESPGSRKLRRQIMTDGIGAIAEVSSDVPTFTSEEHEI